MEQPKYKRVLLKISGDEASYVSSACSFSGMPSNAGSVISAVR